MGEDMKTFVYTVDGKELGEEPFTEMPIDFGRIKPAPTVSEIVLCVEPRGKFVRDITGPGQDVAGVDTAIAHLEKMERLLAEKMGEGGYYVPTVSVLRILMRVRQELKELNL